MSDFGVFDKGWRCWAGLRATTKLNGRSPYDYVEVEIWREEWDKEELVDPCQMNQMMNVHHLWWRPAGPLRKGR